MKTYNDYAQLAADSNLKCGHVTGGRNGYPEPYIGAFVHGFDNYEQAFDFAQQNGGYTAICKQKDGWQVWEGGKPFPRPLTAQNYLSDLGENYGIASIDDVNRELSYKDHEPETILELEYLKAKLVEAKENETVIQYGYAYHDTIPSEMMSYHEDVTTWTVGVFFARQNQNEEES